MISISSTLLGQVKEKPDPKQKKTLETNNPVTIRKVLRDPIFCSQTKRWFIICKARIRIPGQASKRNMKKKRKIFLRRFPLSRFLAKSLRLKNKPAMKKFLKNLSFGVDIKL